ncbi:MAG: TetR family transcriptional regulator [Ahrensia sp.]|nr:TetR family transcriptional regulator [Ahrensia sp.]
MSKTTSQTRRETILRAAYDAFAKYGFRRTSMDDIAKAAGVSRPALYQSFANKGEIFRALIEAHLGHVETELSWHIGQGKPLREMLTDMVESAVIDPHRLLQGMAHGEELLGVKAEVCPDLFDRWEEQLRDLFRDALGRHMGEQEAAARAAVLSLSITGLKAKLLDADAMAKEVAHVIAVVSQQAS